ncbi:MAG: nitroreductase family protein [Bacteroidota bacterium]
MRPSDSAVVDRAIQERRTLKMIVPEPAPTAGALSRESVEQILAVSGLAPFHKPAPAGPPEPWRCYALDADACRALRQRALDAGVGGKVPGMLAAADALVVVTWVPEGASAPVPNLTFAPSLRNMELIAAASAMIQNMLVAATARDIASYWSSGGWLATAPGMEALDVPQGELLLGAIFLFPDAAENAMVRPGKQHAARTDMATWARWVEMA